MNPLRIYAVFHLNLMFSSIESWRRQEVLERCYWPLLWESWLWAAPSMPRSS